MVGVRAFEDCVQDSRGTSKEFHTTRVFCGTLLLYVTRAAEGLLSHEKLRPRVDPRVFHRVVRNFSTLNGSRGTIAKVFKIPSMKVTARGFRRFLVTHRIFKHSLSRDDVRLFWRTGVKGVVCYVFFVRLFRTYLSAFTTND